LEVQQTFGFPFSLLRHCQIPATMLTKAVFELMQQFYHVTEIVNVAIAVSAYADQP